MDMCPTTQLVDAAMPTRPDRYYGVKVFGEQLSRWYWDRFGIETVCLRIGFCFPEPATCRQMCCWLSLNDLVHLLHRSLVTPRVGHTIAFGVSNNPGRWWDDRHSRHLAYQPKDSPAQFAHNFPTAPDWSDMDDPTLKHQGGAFLNVGPKYRP
jgi:uronate dehydrogenase